MDEHIHIDDIARTIGIPAESVRTYAERYALYLPVIRTGSEVWYPPELCRYRDQGDTLRASTTRSSTCAKG